MKILIFGGAFDPPHKGHVSILKKAIQYTDFDKVLVIPTGTPTHKNNCIAPFDVRVYMAKEAFCNIAENIEICDYEGISFKDNYTYLTLQYLQEKYDNPEIFMLIGSDSLINLKTWKNIDYIIKNCTILAFARENKVERIMQIEAEKLTQNGAKIHIIKNDIVPASSSDYREKIHDNINLNDILPENVNKIVIENKIYSSDETERLKGTSKLLAKLMLDEKRYQHTLNVEKLAVELGQIYHVDTDKLRISALLHDILKYASNDILLHRTQQSDIMQNTHIKPLQTLHGFAAADYAEKELKIKDKEILWALRSHTCGRSEMQDIEKIIYLADMLCAERKFDKKEYLLSIARENLDKAMCESLKHSIEWVQSKGNAVDLDSVQALEYFEKLLNS